MNTCFLFFALESRSTASNDKAKALSDIKPAKKSDSKILINPPAPVGAKGRVFPEALATGTLAWGGEGHFLCR